MDKLVESINFASDSYWGDPKKFQFRAMIDSYSTQVSLEIGRDRAVKSTFNIVLNGYIIPESLNKEVASSNRLFSTSQVIFGLEVAGSTDQFNANVNKPARQSIAAVTANDSINVTVNNIYNTGGGNLDSSYLNTNNLFTASVITGNVVTFNNRTIVQPSAGSTLPPTSITNFTLYRNGQYIGGEYIISISQVNTDVVATLNTSSLGYGLESTDTIELIGKIQ
jgi:hypothetical protein